MTDERFDVLLWGSTAVGKTSALACWLCSGPAVIATEASETFESRRRLLPIYTAIGQNRLTPATAAATQYLVRARNGRLIQFQDIRGGHALDPAAHRSEAESLRTAHAILLFAPWPAGASTTDQQALRNALSLAPPSTPRALVLTKLESYLSPPQLLRFHHNPLEFVATEPNLWPLHATLMEFGAGIRVFPLTVYGYRDNHLPAQYRDELGRLVPWGVRPRFVQEPFEYILLPAVGG